jgi:hypothetical protein
MKTKEEIERLAFLEYPRLINDPYNPMEDDNSYERKIWIDAYTQCQEDMADEIVNFHEWIRHQKPSELKYVGNVNGKCYDYKREYYTTKELYSIYQSLKNEKL